MELRTISDAIEYLHNKGYELDFELDNTGLNCKSIEDKISSSMYTIDQEYHFLNSKTDNKRSIIYAISVTEFNSKGILIDSY